MLKDRLLSNKFNSRFSIKEHFYFCSMHFLTALVLSEINIIGSRLNQDRAGWSHHLYLPCYFHAPLQLHRDTLM